MPSPVRRRLLMRAGFRALIGALTLTFAVSGCVGGEDANEGNEAAPAVSSAPVDSFELYALASAENNRLFADIYAITMGPLTTHRITAGKRISLMDADRDHVVVAAADGDVDRLGFVSTGGEIVEIPGLGRPPGYNPRTDDGRILFSDFILTGPEKIQINRYFSFDPSTRKRTTLLRTKGDLFGPLPLPGELHGYGTAEKQTPRLLVKDGGRTVRSFPISPLARDLYAGERWMALQLVADGDGFDRPSLGLDLLDPKSGEKHHVDGWQPIAWNPAGTKLLVRRAGAGADSELGLLDPDRPQAAPQPLGTLPNLVVYSGAWVQRGQSATP